MRVGVYIDGFNLFYGGRALCGRGTAGWRWLDLRALTLASIGLRWQPVTMLRIVYCTAKIGGERDAQSRLDQEAYLKALERSGAVDVIEYGDLVRRYKQSRAAEPGRRRVPLILGPETARGVEHPALLAVGDELRVGHEHIEEKGSDVNVASHLLHDVLGGHVDAAVVVTNDSDLALPLRLARDVVPVGTVNPRGNHTAGALRGASGDGVGGHWWSRLGASDFTEHQLPASVPPVSRPNGW
ncbi:MAG: NYN domain-containing protein [Patulibacter sp.]